MIQIDFDAVHRLATVGSLVEPLRRAFLSPAVSPARAHHDLDAADQPRSLLLMPSWQPDGAIGVKIVTVFPGNAARGSASVNAVYLLLSGQTGQPRAWIDGRALTLFRTAAVSALAADLLAPATPAVLLMVGTGALSRYLIEGHRAVRTYPSILIWGRDPQKAAAVARDLSGRGWPVRATADLQTAVRSADVISCDCLRGAFIAVDTLDALQASGDLISPLAAGVIVNAKISSLTDLVAQTDKAARASRTVFKTIGVAHADLAAAEQIYERHLSRVERQ
jgi:alanine dehydrogenase